MLSDRETVHHHEPCRGVRVIHRGAECDERASVMARHGEPLVAEVPHQRDHVAGHRPHGRLSVLRRIGR